MLVITKITPNPALQGCDVIAKNVAQSDAKALNNFKLVVCVLIDSRIAPKHATLFSVPTWFLWASGLLSTWFENHRLTHSSFEIKN